MKLSILIVVVLRLFAIMWAVRCGIGVLGALGMSGLTSSGSGFDLFQIALHFAAPVIYGLFAALAWIFAGAISRRVVGAVDSDLRFSEVDPENLYTLGILGVGLYYALGNLAGTINWLHYLAANDAGQSMLDGTGGLSLYEVTSVMIPFAAGAAVAVLSPKLGVKLARAGRSAQINQAEQVVDPNRSSAPLPKSESSVRGSDD